MSSRSWISHWWRYLSTRFKPARMLPLVLLLLAASCVGSQPTNLIAASVDMLLAALLVLQFRLWDDLSDVPFDRQHHPERVLVQAHSLLPYSSLLLLVGVANAIIAIWTRPANVAITLMNLHVGLLIWYELIRHNNWRVANFHLVLLKYPVFVFILASRTDSALHPALLASMGCVFFLLCVVEVLHDSHLRAHRTATTIAGVESVALVVLLFVAGTSFVAARESDSAARSKARADIILGERNQP